MSKMLMSKMLPPFLTSSSESKAVGWIWHWQLSVWLREKIQSITQYYISIGCRITAAGYFSSRAFYTFEVAALARIWNSSSTLSWILANPEHHTICFFFMTESNRKHTELFFFFLHLCIFSSSSSNKEQFLIYGLFLSQRMLQDAWLFTEY